MIQLSQSKHPRISFRIRISMFVATFVGFLFSQALMAQSTLWTLGPMLHYNFSKDRDHFSFGVEIAYWNYSKFPYSFDAGLELGKKRLRLYSEVQTGIGLAGISAGPVLELNRSEKKTSLGFQSTLWANYFLGVSYRYRSVGGNRYHCPGVYVKAPMMYNSDPNSDKNYFDWDD